MKLKSSKFDTINYVSYASYFRIAGLSQITPLWYLIFILAAVLACVQVTSQNIVASSDAGKIHESQCI